MPSGDTENDGDEGLEKVIAGVIIIVLVGALLWCCARVLCCCSCCCRRCCPSWYQRLAPAETDRGAGDSATVKVGGKDIPMAHLMQKKELWTAYLLWMSVGLMGAHHFYLDRLVHGVLSLLTLNFLSCGWIVDLFCLPFYVRNFNSRTAGSAHHDASCRHICFRLPIVMTLWFCVVLTGFIKTPRILHSLTVVDLDRDIAKTKENPYSILGVLPGDDDRTVTRAYQEQKRRVQRTPCDRKCKEQLAELNKAYLFMNKDWKQELQKERENEAKNEAKKKNKKEARTRRREQKTHDGEASNPEWSDWTDFVTLEWKVVTNRATQALEYIGESFFSSGQGNSTSDEEL